MNFFQPKVHSSARLPNKRLVGESRLGTIFGLSVAVCFGFFLSHHTINWFDSLFGFLILACLLGETYWLNGPRFETARLRPLNFPENQVELFTPDNPVYAWRHELRIALHFCLAITSLVMCFQFKPTSSSLNSLLVLIFFVFSLIFQEWFAQESIKREGLGTWAYWLLSTILTVLLSIFFNNLEQGRWLGLLAAAIGTGIAFMIYLSRRVDVSEHIWSEVIGDLSLQVLNTPRSLHDMDQIVNLIAKRLGYEHVSLLKPMDGNNTLQIVSIHGAGNQTNIKGTIFSIDEGINGRAYRTGQTCAWNDVSFCPYYKSLSRKDQDQTRAEIAVPVTHQGRTLGILDVQSRSELVFGPGDLRTLEIIAHILGAAWAAEKTDILIEQGKKLWDELTGEIHSENDVFENFAEFAQQDLGADLVIYYRLSPTGYPIRAPQVVGELISGERMNSPVQLLQSPLFGLIKDWKPHFEKQVQNGGKFLYENPSGKPSFSVREKIKSAYFIPIGMADERMAVVFLNYRREQEFDGLFQMMVQSFAQGFATTLAREWYRDLIFHGLARPELGVHNILGRYGMKDGVMQQGREIIRSQQHEKPGSVEQHILDLLQDVDNCLIEIRAQTAKVSINWESTLRERVDDMTNKIKEHVPASRTVRFIKNLDPHVERESPWTRLALYRVIEEAVSNAIFHGEANEISIFVARTDDAVILSVQNNGGIPLPENAKDNHSRSGIFEILEEVKEHFRAQVQIKALHNGTIVKVQMPALPIIKKERPT